MRASPLSSRPKPTELVALTDPADLTDQSEPSRQGKHRQAEWTNLEPSKPADETPNPPPSGPDHALIETSHPNRNRWLIAIGVLKLLKAILFVAMGFGMIRLLHKDIADVLYRAVLALRFDPENHIINVLLEKSTLLSPRILKEISAGMFLYAILDTIEGIGLVLEKTWAEYFTLGLTGALLPWEMYEIIRHVTILKIVVTIVNLAVFLYLLYVVAKKNRTRRANATPAH
jgi:uncharacterized membrane protein (DUF2068 family)